MMSMVLERCWTHFWIWALNGVLYLRKESNVHAGDSVTQTGTVVQVHSLVRPPRPVAEKNKPRTTSHLISRINANKPVAHEGPQNHQAILHAGDDLWCAVSSQQKLSAILEVGKCKSLVVPLGNHLLQLLLNVSFFDSTDADILLRNPQILLSREKFYSQRNVKKKRKTLQSSILEDICLTLYWWKIFTLAWLILTARWNCWVNWFLTMCMTSNTSQSHIKWYW